MTGRPRVLLLSQAPGVGGGERSVVEALARAEELDVTVAAHSTVCAFARRSGLAAVELVLPPARRLVDVLRLPRSGARVRTLARRLRSDVMYANGIRAVGPALAARVLGGPPLLVHHHGQFGTGPLRPYVAGIRRWADAIVTDSAWSARPFGSTPKLRVVPNGVDLDRFGPVADLRAAKTALGLPSDAFVVGMLARSHPSKGADDFLELSHRLPEARLVLAGGPAFAGEETFYAQLEGKVAHGGGRVVLTGALDDPRPVYGAMDVLAHLAQPEGLSLVLLEAWACGLPIVSYRWGAAADAVEDGVNGLLVEPGRIDEVARAIRRLIGDAGHRDRLSQHARRRCEERYGLERTAAALTREVHTLL